MNTSERGVPSIPVPSCESLTEVALALREKGDLGPKQGFRLAGVGLSNFEEPVDNGGQPPLFQ